MASWHRECRLSTGLPRSGPCRSPLTIKQTFGRFAAPSRFDPGLTHAGSGEPTRGGRRVEGPNDRRGSSARLDGATIGIGGLSINSAPMAFVRELVRRDVQDLTVVAIVASMAVDWLVAAGRVSKVITGLVSFEGFGLAPNFRRGRAGGRYRGRGVLGAFVDMPLAGSGASPPVRAHEGRYRNGCARSAPGHDAARDGSRYRGALRGVHAVAHRCGNRSRARSRPSGQRAGRPEADMGWTQTSCEPPAPRW